MSIRAFGLLVMLLALSAYSFFRPGLLEPARCQQPEANCVDRTVQLTHHARVTQLLPGGFVIQQLGTTARVVGDITGLAVGDSISLRGTWQADDTIRAEAWRVSRHRNWRLLVSVPAVMVSAWLFWRTFRWDNSRRAFVARDHA